MQHCFYEVVWSRESPDSIPSVLQPEDKKSIVLMMAGMLRKDPNCHQKTRMKVLMGIFDAIVFGVGRTYPRWGQL